MIWLFVLLLMLAIEAPGWLFFAWLVSVFIKLLFVMR